MFSLQGTLTEDLKWVNEVWYTKVMPL